MMKKYSLESPLRDLSKNTSLATRRDISKFSDLEVYVFLSPLGRPLKPGPGGQGEPIAVKYVLNLTIGGGLWSNS